MSEVNNKPRWSEEDEMMLECVLDKIGDLGTGEMCKEWLINLKDRYSWKPSELQMECLSAAIEESNENPVLESLYKDLKKLKV